MYVIRGDDEHRITNSSKNWRTYLIQGEVLSEEGIRDVKIEEASTENLTELAGLQKAYMQYHKNLDRYFSFKENISELWTEWAEKLLEDENQVVYCAFMEGKIVGYVTGHIAKRPPVYEIEEIGQIGDVFVQPEHRGHGIFTALLEKVVNWIGEKGMTYVEHAVASSNELGRDVWKKKGFEDFMVFIRKEL